MNREALKALAERVMNDRRFCCDEQHRFLAEGVNELLAENETLRKDAKRYRFVRNPIGTRSPLAIWNEGRMPLFCAMADAVVDKLMAKEAAQ
ncbi:MULTISPECIES: hypothetical protein [Pseudomonas]|uniref:hypothetical protein n=1 Tax=Pseudomonas TaxID=286 RepID=UPI0008636D68|nr:MULTISPECIES: hypothetical protein [Pseudomonas]MBH3374272.1 hypothetical protein [Pseudomonas juntendi]CAH0646708.1 hypothetical protein PSNVIR_00961 [Pseudomonas sp. Nvir]